MDSMDSKREFYTSIPHSKMLAEQVLQLTDPTARLVCELKVPTLSMRTLQAKKIDGGSPCWGLGKSPNS